jgi:predicted Zn-ribbon and HTH transcriptional regulator
MSNMAESKTAEGREAVRKDILRQATKDAIRRGTIKVPDNCAECGAETKLDCHHQEYDDPMNVVFLCVRCHDKRHGYRARGFALVPDATCGFCGHVWQPRVKRPELCPRCHHADFDKPDKKKRKVKA